MKESQTILLHKTLMGHSKIMSHAYRGGGSTKKGLKCDIGGMDQSKVWYHTFKCCYSYDDVSKEDVGKS